MPETKTKPKLRTITCSICKRAISYDLTVMSSGKAIMDHKNTEHVLEMAELRGKALAARRQKAQERHDNSQGSQVSHTVPKPREEAFKTTTSPEEANVFVIKPLKYDINSLFILIAKHICENEWKWPEMSVSQWLDSYLFHTMRQRGYVIGAYQKSEVSDGRH